MIDLIPAAAKHRKILEDEYKKTRSQGETTMTTKNKDQQPICDVYFPDQETMSQYQIIESFKKINAQIEKIQAELKEIKEKQP